jgi:hypothetical protein
MGSSALARAASSVCIRVPRLDRCSDLVCSRLEPETPGRTLKAHGPTRLSRSTLIGQAVGVSLTDGSTLSLSQNVVVSTGAEIKP